MEPSLALTIIGVVMIVVGIIFNAIPKVVNEKTMPNLPVEAVTVSALFRVVNGGLGIAIGTVALYSRKLPAEYASIVLFSLGSGFIIVILTLFSGKLRGFENNLPIPPIILFTILTIIAYISA